MNRLEQRIAIAKSTGYWTDIQLTRGSNLIGGPFNPRVQHVEPPHAVFADQTDTRVTLPDYHNDLVRIKTIVEGLPKELLDYRNEGNFWEILGEVTGANDAEALSKAYQRICTAGADKWCEAYLRVKGLWK